MADVSRAAIRFAYDDASREREPAKPIIDISLARDDDAVVVRNVSKRFGTAVAVDDISFRVPRGIVLALVGPNGAGKTTLMESIMGAQKPDSGEIHVLGSDVIRQPRIARQRIGVQLQETRLLPKVKVWEYLALFAGFYDELGDVDAIARALGIDDKLQKRVGNLSGGQRQRVALALALINNPDLLILDEPTTGFDPILRQQFWSTLKALRAEGRTVMISTHHMEEAEALADCILMISRGRLLVAGTAESLKGMLGKPGGTLDDVYGAFLREPEARR